MKKTTRTITQASYAPSGDREFVKQAVAQQRVKNRQADAAKGGQEIRRPVLGKNAEVNQELRENTALTIIKAELKVKKYIKSMESDRRKLSANKDSSSTAGAIHAEEQGKRTMIKESIVTSNKCVQREKETSHAAATVMPKKSESLMSLKPNSDLAILGHGAAGKSFLGGTPGNIMSLAQVAKDMKYGGMSPLQQNVRMTSCESADALRRTSFVIKPKSKEREKGSLPKVAPAKSLANEMKANGFKRTTVTGYQGNGVSNPDGLTAERQIQSDTKTRTPASTVEHTFKPDRSCTIS